MSCLDDGKTGNQCSVIYFMKGLTMPKVNPQEWADNWQKGLSNNITKVKRGVERTKKNPMQRAIQELPKMRTNFNKAMDEGRIQAGFNRVSFEEWRNKFIQKGLPRIEQGAREAVNDVAKFAQEISPHIDAGLQVLEGMSSTTSADNDARMLYWKHHMEEFKRS